jgi:hypothetical protein
MLFFQSNFGLVGLSPFSAFGIEARHMSPLQGSGVGLGRYTQGDALGCHMAPRWG